MSLENIYKSLVKILDTDRSVTYGSPDSVSVGSSSTLVVDENGARKYLCLVNDSDEAIYLGFGKTAVMNKGIRLNSSGGSFEMSKAIGNLTHKRIYAICSSGSKVLLITGGV